MERKNTAVEFSYGDETATVQIPTESILKTLELKEIPVCHDPLRAVEEALQHPIGTKRLSDLAKGKKNILIMVPDRSRKFPLNIVIPPILSEIFKAGVKKKNIRFLIGAGTHRSMTQQEIKKHFGEALFKEYHSQIFNHEWWKPEQMICLDTTPNGTPISINKFVLQADLKIAVGAVKPHRDAGWSGGAKMIQPGVSGFITTGYTHWLASQYSQEEILGKTNNPVRREMEQIAGQVGLDFIVNCVLSNHYEVSEVFSGHYIAAHRLACAAARQYFTVEINELCDILICGTSASQTSMWSVASGPNWGDSVLKEGGTIVVFAKCDEGVCEEHPDVLKYGYLPFEQVKNLVDSGSITDLPAASHLQHGGEKLYGEKNIHCILASNGIPRENIKKLHLEYAESPQAAVELAFARHGSKAKVYLYPSFYFAELLINKKFNY